MGEVASARADVAAKVAAAKWLHGEGGGGEGEGGALGG
jgi:hypothetical protein